MTNRQTVPPFSRLRQVGDAAVASGIVPGLVVAVGAPTLAGESAFLCFGTLGSRQTPVTRATNYDLASLTKPICTSVLTMQAVNEGRLQLADPVARWVPQAPADITIEHVLTHTTGWPAHRKLYQELVPDASGYSFVTAPLREELVRQAAVTPLEASPGTRLMYSDLGFIVLGKVLETIFERPLDEAFATRVALPLRCPGLCFNPKPFEVAPTEKCGWRSRLLTGQVHDQNAWIMGGVAGHAGLFGSAQDLAVMTASLLRSYEGNTQSRDPVAQTTLLHFWTHRGPASATWALGWDRPSTGFSLAGQRISREAVGHLGFTGCSLWIDPLAHVFVVTLCNRLYPELREDPRFRLLRPAIMDAALEDVGYMSGIAVT